MVWLPHQHPAAASTDGRDAALVCLISLGVAAGAGVGGGSGSSPAVLRSGWSLDHLCDPLSVGVGIKFKKSIAIRLSLSRFVPLIRVRL